MLTVAIPKRNKLQNIIVLTPKDGNSQRREEDCKINRLQDVVAVDKLSTRRWEGKNGRREKRGKCRKYLTTAGLFYITCLSELS